MINKYVFAALSIAVAIGPARALDAGLDGKAGGIGVGADAGVGREGASLGGGAKADGVGGANLGGSVGTGNGAPSAGVGAGGNVDGVGGANLGGSVGTGREEATATARESLGGRQAVRLAACPQDQVPRQVARPAEAQVQLMDKQFGCVRRHRPKPRRPKYQRRPARRTYASCSHRPAAQPWTL